MKNADMPAMPQTITDSNDNSGLVGSHMEDEWSGLTKREMFAMHAPSKIPSWFTDNWFSLNEKEYIPTYCDENGYVIAGLKRTRSVSFEGMMKMNKDWRYAYADMMLSEA